MTEEITQMSLLHSKFDNLTNMVERNHEEIKMLLADHETRLRFLETRSAELSARLTMLSMIQAGFTALAATVAATLGRLR